MYHRSYPEAIVAALREMETFPFGANTATARGIRAARELIEMVIFANRLTEREMAERMYELLTVLEALPGIWVGQLDAEVRQQDFSLRAEAQIGWEAFAILIAEEAPGCWTVTRQ